MRNAIERVACSAAIIAIGCTVWTPQAGRPELVAVGEQGPIRVVRSDRSVVVLVAPALIGDSLVGATQGEPPRRVAIPLADIERIERREPSLAKTINGALTGVTLLAAVITTIPIVVILTRIL